MPEALLQGWCCYNKLLVPHTTRKTHLHLMHYTTTFYTINPSGKLLDNECLEEYPAYLAQLSHDQTEALYTCR